MRDVMAESVGKRIKRIRDEKGLSQRQLSSPGVSYAYISRIEAGARTPSVKALRKLADKLGVSAHYLEHGFEEQVSVLMIESLFSLEFIGAFADPREAELWREYLGGTVWRLPVDSDTDVDVLLERRARAVGVEEEIVRAMVEPLPVESRS